MPAPAPNILLEPYRSVRRIEAGPDAPFPATLCRLPTAEMALLVDVEHLPTQWPGWTARPGGHVLTPIDVVRRADGHDVLLPVLATRLGDLMQRRHGESRPFTDGEAVTVAVSLLRGLDEMRAEWPVERGEWWLTDAGFPALITGCGPDAAIEATLTALEDVVAGRRGGPWPGLVEAARHPRLPAVELARLEDELFAAARARAIDLSERPASFRATSTADRRDDGDDAPPERRGIWEQWARHVDADLADTFSRATTGVWRRLRAGRGGGSRKRVWFIAVAIAALVVTGGLLWPSEPESGAIDPSTGATPGPSASVSAPTDVTTAPHGASEPTSSSAPAPVEADGTGAEAQDSPPGTASDLAAITADLLTARSACLDAGCGPDVLVDPASAFPAGVIDMPANERTVSLLDEFGGVAVLRVDALNGGADSQLVVVERAGERWLLRDVHVAQQP